MRILVLGGTVFLSRAVAEHAAAAGHDVTCACRGTAPLPSGVRHLPLDRSAGAPALAERYDAVVDVARIPSWVRAAVTRTPGAHWVFVSSISAYADHTKPGGRPDTVPVLDPLDEDRDPMESPETYGRMKVACEQAVTGAAASAAVVRPGLVVGPGDPTGRFTYWPVRLGRGGRVLAPGRPDDPVQVVDVRDLAAFLVHCAADRVTGTFDAIGPVLTRADLLAQVSAGVGGQPVELVWRDDAWLEAQGVEPWAGPRSLPLWLPGASYAGMLAHDPEPAHAAGLSTRSVSETARDTLAWVRGDRGAPVTGLTDAEEAELLAGG